MGENVIGRWLDVTFGVRGRQNILSWALAGGLAYYLFYLPEQRKMEEHKVLYEQNRKKYEQKGLWDIDKSKPIPDKQQSGLIVGSGLQQVQLSDLTPCQRKTLEAMEGKTAQPIPAAAVAVERPAAGNDK